MEASAFNHSAHVPALVGRSPLLRLQGDERLIAYIRRGHHGAFETLVGRYESRLLSFCRHMLGSTEDAEDVLQEVFASAFNAICADERPINARPWLYRIARNRCLNHLRRPVPTGQDSMDIFERDGGASTADTVHKREEFRRIVLDVKDLPETQRTALLLREIDALSYDQIAEAMDTTVPSVKSLLVRARVSLAEAAEARMLTCEEVRLELGQVAEGIAKSTPPGRRHLKGCDRCRAFKGELRRTNRALAAIYPIGPLIIIKKLFVAKLGTGAMGGGSAGVAGGSAGTAGVAGSAGAGMAGSTGVAGVAAASGTVGGGAGAVATAGGASSAGLISSFGGGALATKAAAGVVAAAIVTAGAVEVRQQGVTTGRGSEAPPAASAPSEREVRPPTETLTAPVLGAALTGLAEDAAAEAAKPEGAAETTGTADAPASEEDPATPGKPGDAAEADPTGEPSTAPVGAPPAHAAAPGSTPNPGEMQHGSGTVRLAPPPLPAPEDEIVAPEDSGPSAAVPEAAAERIAAEVDVPDVLKKRSEPKLTKAP